MSVGEWVDSVKVTPATSGIEKPQDEADADMLIGMIKGWASGNFENATAKTISLPKRKTLFCQVTSDPKLPNFPGEADYRKWLLA